MSNFMKSDPLLLEPYSNNISAKALAIAKNHPKDFLPYLRRVWERDGKKVLESPTALAQLQQTKVLCEKGELRPLGTTWVPLPRLTYQRSNILRPSETFRFIHLDPPLPINGTFGSWRFLKDLGCRFRLNLSFYIDLLIDLRSCSPSVAETPRRVWNLYQQIIVLFLIILGTDPRKELEFNEYVTKKFEANSLILHNGTWVPPSKCVRHGPKGLFSRRRLMPMAAEWRLTPMEIRGAGGFFGHILAIPDFKYAWSHLLYDLNQHRKSKAFASLGDIRHLYYDLRKLAMDNNGVAVFRPNFVKEPFIAIKCGGSIKWLTLLDCIWSPGLKVEDKVDLSVHYPDLRSFFVDNLKLPKYTSQEVWTELLSLPDNASVERSRDLFLTLNTLAITNPTSLERPYFTKPAIYPVKTQKGRIIRVSGDSDFFIADKAHLADSFSGKANILAFTPRDVLRLEQYFTWAGMKNRYLSSNVQEKIAWPSESKPTQIEWDIALKAEGIVRIATYFGSPRADTPAARKTLLKSLRQGQMLEVDGMFSKSNLITGQESTTWLGPSTKYDPTIAIRSTFPQPRVSNSVGRLEFGDNPNRLIVHVPADKKQQELARFLALPGLLMKCLMTNPKTKEVGKIHEAGVGIMKDVLNAPTSLVGGILKLEGIPDVEDLKWPEEFSVDR
ncbi:hypothetical protein ACHAPJ_003854 [Fusarium lateritium]